jgi:hypothetical protein
VKGVPGRKARPILERIAEKVALTDDGCVIWTGSLDIGGYGQIGVGSKRDRTNTKRKVHRLLYELTVGPVPAGLDLDHLCRNRACCRPDHLEPVTRRENLARGTGLIGQQLARLTCAHGHPYTPENTYMDNGARVCRTCKAIRARLRRAAS